MGLGLARDEEMVVEKGRGGGGVSVPAGSGGPSEHPKPLKEAVCIHREAPKGA